MRVLIIDDMSFARDFIRQNLKNLGFEGEIDEAKDLRTAMDLLQESIQRKNRYDLIVTDLNLPDGSSTELVKKIRATKSYKALPIILMTTEDNRDRIVEAIASGINDYCFKPVEPLDLFNKVKAFIK